DISELDTLYGTPQGKKAVGAIQGDVRQLASGMYHYDYLVNWTDGPEIPLVQIGTNRNPVSTVTAGGIPLAGTSALSPSDNGGFLYDPRDPATGQGFLDDLDFPDASPGDPLDYLSLVNFLGPLGPTNSSFTFGFDSPEAPGTVLGYTS